MSDVRIPPTLIQWADAVEKAIRARDLPLVSGPRWYGKEALVRDIAKRMGADLVLVTDVEVGLPRPCDRPTLVVVPDIEALSLRALRTVDQWSLTAAAQQPPHPWDRATLVLLANLASREFAADNPYAFQRVNAIAAKAATVDQLSAAAPGLSPVMVEHIHERTGGHPFLASTLLDAARAGQRLTADVERDRCAPFLRALTQGPLAEPGVRAVVRDLASGSAVTLTRAQWRELRSWGMVDGSAHRPRLQPPLVADWARALD